MYRISYPTTSGGLRLGVSPDDLSQEARIALGITKGKMQIPLFSGLDDATAFKRWQKSQKQLQHIVSMMGTRFMEQTIVWSKQQALDVKAHIAPLEDEIAKLREETFCTIHSHRTPILDACNWNPEVKKLVDECIANLTLAGMTRDFKIEEVPIPNHTPNDEVDRMVASSATNDLMALAHTFTDGAKDLFKRLANMGRVRKEDPTSQVGELRTFLTSIGPFLEQYSDSPELIADMKQAQKIFEGCKVPTQGDPDTVEDVKSRCQEALAIFERPQAQATPEPENPFKDGHFTASDEFEQDTPARTFEVDSRPTEQATVTRYGWGSDDEPNF